jgi:hypothetical protein
MNLCWSNMSSVKQIEEWIYANMNSFFFVLYIYIYIYKRLQIMISLSKVSEYLHSKALIQGNYHLFLTYLVYKLCLQAFTCETTLCKNYLINYTVWMFWSIYLLLLWFWMQEETVAYVMQNMWFPVYSSLVHEK